MEVPQLTEQERIEILEQIHQREFLEKQALEQEKAARQQRSEIEHRQSLADAARRTEEERRQRLLDGLSSASRLIQEALEAFREGDERKTYVLLAKADPFFLTTKHQLNRQPERPTSGNLPTVRVKADNAMGFAIINLEDLSPAHEILEDGK